MTTVALDIGGANLKAVGGPADAEPSSTVVEVRPFAVWRDPAGLAREIESLLAALPAFDRLAVTMTAELCDCFETKRAGVHHVLDAVAAATGERSVTVWRTDGRLVPIAEAKRSPRSCAASNWLALAAFVATTHPSGRTLLVDTGSTTTDLVPLHAGRPVPRGRTDRQRLAAGELVYCGAARTPLAWFGPSLSVGGRPTGLMAEWFATTADVYVLTGDTPERQENCDTPDGRPLTRRAAAARVARMIGEDLEALGEEETVELAKAFAAAQRRVIADAAARQDRPDRIVVSGSGAFIAERAMGEFPWGDPPPILRLADEIGEAGSDAACAYALWRLAGQSPSMTAP